MRKIRGKIVLNLYNSSNEYLMRILMIWMSVTHGHFEEKKKNNKMLQDMKD